jgi:hypothetical protein
MADTTLPTRRRWFRVFVAVALVLAAILAAAPFIPTVVSKVLQRRAYHSIRAGMHVIDVVGLMGPFGDEEIPRPTYEIVEGDDELKDDAHALLQRYEFRKGNYAVRILVREGAVPEYSVVKHKAYLRQSDASWFWRLLDRMGL